MEQRQGTARVECGGELSKKLQCNLQLGLRVLGPSYYYCCVSLEHWVGAKGLASAEETRAEVRAKQKKEIHRKEKKH